MFFRDVSQSWHQNGLPGVGGDVYGIGEYIERKIEQTKAREIYFVGNSMGGYAAILFASMVGRGTATAFAPQTFMSPIKKLVNMDMRWAWQVSKTCFRTIAKRHVWDLAAWFSKNGNEAKIDIFVSKRHRLDHLHARQLQGFNMVNLYEYEVGGHHLVKHLRDEGALSSMLWGTYAQQGAAQDGHSVVRHSCQ